MAAASKGFHPLAGKRFEKAKDCAQRTRYPSLVSIPLRGKGLRKLELLKRLTTKGGTDCFHPLAGKRFEKVPLAIYASGLPVSIPLRGKGLRKLKKEVGAENMYLFGFHPLAGKRFEKVKNPPQGQEQMLFPSPCGEKV